MGSLHLQKKTLMSHSKMFGLIWITKLMFRKTMNWISGSTDSSVTKGGVSFLLKVRMVLAEAMKSMYFIHTRTALDTTAVFA